MDDVFQRFSINPSDISPNTVVQCHKAYHEILTSLERTREDSGDLTTNRNKVRSEWLNSTDLPSDLHNIIDDTEHLLLSAALDNPDDPEAVKLLAPAYERMLRLTALLKNHLDDRVNRVINPGGRRTSAVGTKA